MRTGIATVCLSGTLKEKMQACAIAGFDGIEIFEQDLVTSSLSPEDVRKMAADLGLTLDLYQPFRDFDSVPEDLLAANLRRAEAKFKLMSRLGMDTILVCSNVGTATIDDDDLRAEQLSRLAGLAGDHGVKVAYEALAWGKYVNDYEHAHRLVETVDHPNLGTCLDSFHILSRDWDTAPIEAFNADKIFFVQVADAPEALHGCPVLEPALPRVPGRGTVRARQIHGPRGPRRVHRAGLAGGLQRRLPPVRRRTHRRGRHAVADLAGGTERQMARRERPAPGRRRGGRPPRWPAAVVIPWNWPPCPQVAEPAGFNFAEVKAADTAGLETLLGQLGFEFNGRHRTKDVQLWTMGHARVIINEQDPDSPHAGDGAAAVGPPPPPSRPSASTSIRP